MLGLITLFLLAERGFNSNAERPASVDRRQGTAQLGPTKWWRPSFTPSSGGKQEQRVLGGDGRIPEDPRAPLFPAFTTTSENVEPEIYEPYPRHNSRPWRGRRKGRYKPCIGPRGEEVDIHPEDQIKGYTLPHDESLPPSPTFGSFEELEIDPSLCFDRWSRFNPAGFDEEKLDVTRDVDEDVAPRLDWGKVDWRSLQDDCLSRNSDRYEPSASQKPNQTTFRLPTAQDFEEVDDTLVFPAEGQGSWWHHDQYLTRKGVVVQMGAGTEWTLDTVQWLRSLILELNLQSGGEYELIILVEVKDADTAIFEDKGKYANVLRVSAPAEFQKLVVLWTPELLQLWYGQATFFSPLQRQQAFHQRSLLFLSLARPDLDLFFSISRSTRYTSSTYPLLKAMETWSTTQSRKHLWERNSLFYLPAVHGSYSNFSAYVANLTSSHPSTKRNEKKRLKVIHGKESKQKQNISSTIFGPIRTPGVEPIGPDPPPFSSPEAESWGISEPADLIASGPIFDTTLLTLPAELSGYPVPSFSSKTHSKSSKPNSEMPIRQLSSLSIVGYSKRLTRAMHHVLITLGPSSPSSLLPNEPNGTSSHSVGNDPLPSETSSSSIHLDASKFAPTTALQHGLKAVSVPVPWYVDLARMHSDIDAEVNLGRFGGKRDEEGNWIGGWGDSSFSPDQESEDESEIDPTNTDKSDIRARVAKGKALKNKSKAKDPPPSINGITIDDLMPRRLAALIDLEHRVSIPLDGLESYLYQKHQALEAAQTAELKRKAAERKKVEKEAKAKGEEPPPEEEAPRQSVDTGFGDELYKRWIGYGKDEREKLCLPAMMLGPVGGV